MNDESRDIIEGGSFPIFVPEEYELQYGATLRIVADTLAKRDLAGKLGISDIHGIEFVSKLEGGVASSTWHIAFWNKSGGESVEAVIKLSIPDRFEEDELKRMNCLEVIAGNFLSERGYPTAKIYDAQLTTSPEDWVGLKLLTDLANQSIGNKGPETSECPDYILFEFIPGQSIDKVEDFETSVAAQKAYYHQLSKIEEEHGMIFTDAKGANGIIKESGQVLGIDLGSFAFTNDSLLWNQVNGIVAEKAEPGSFEEEELEKLLQVLQGGTAGPKHVGLVPPNRDLGESTRNNLSRFAKFNSIFTIWSSCMKVEMFDKRDAYKIMRLTSDYAEGEGERPKLTEAEREKIYYDIYAKLANHLFNSVITGNFEERNIAVEEIPSIDELADLRGEELLLQVINTMNELQFVDKQQFYWVTVVADFIARHLTKMPENKSLSEVSSELLDLFDIQAKKLGARRTRIMAAVKRPPAADDTQRFNRPPKLEEPGDTTKMVAGDTQPL